MERSANLSQEALAAFRAVVRTHQVFVDARKALLREGRRVDLVRMGLDDPSARAVALTLVPYLDVAEQQAIFPDLLAVATYGHGLTDEAVAILVALPRTWVLENIAQSAELCLEHGGQEAYRMLFRIYGALDAPNLASQLADRAAIHSDPEVREAGEARRVE